MIVFTRRSGTVLHATQACAELARGPILRIHDEDAPRHAARCDHAKCAAVFLRAGESPRKTA